MACCFGRRPGTVPCGPPGTSDRNHDCRGRREDQILELVDRYDIELWAAVDDREDGFPTTAAMHLAKTEYFDGLNGSTFTRLAWILQL